MTQPPQGFTPSVAEPQDFAPHPLIEFEGELKETTAKTQHNERTNRDSMSVTFEFIDVEVIDSREPYPFPTASIRIPYSDRPSTQWAAWTKTFRNIVPAEAYATMGDPTQSLVGKKQRWKFTHCKLRRPVVDEEGNQTKEWAEQDGEAWQIQAVEGWGQVEGGPNITELIVDFADGKGDQEILNYVFTEQSLKSLPGFNDTVSAAASRTLLKTLVDAGKLDGPDNDGRYHKKAGE